ncbi:hypothetical protein [Helicobacter bizzozeronii]|uniref:hypothetical protein n=1 Tax=Helicobacter bizzozeronii TaxID=56877 RepID=UPI001F44A8E4|nr:hypothetical protein [Helicobacter bizzozeronii]
MKTPIFLNAVLEDGGIKGIDLSTSEGDTLEFMRVLKKLGFGLQALALSKSHAT